MLESASIMLHLLVYMTKDLLFAHISNVTGGRDHTQVIEYCCFFKATGISQIFGRCSVIVCVMTPLVIAKSKKKKKALSHSYLYIKNGVWDVTFFEVMH